MARAKQIDFNALAERVAIQIAKKIVTESGATRKERVEEFGQYVLDSGGDLLHQKALDSLVADDAGDSEEISLGMEKFWKAIRPMVIAELEIELEPYADAVQKEFDEFEEEEPNEA